MDREGWLVVSLVGAAVALLLGLIVYIGFQHYALTVMPRPSIPAPTT